MADVEGASMTHLEGVGYQRIEEGRGHHLMGKWGGGNAVLLPCSEGGRRQPWWRLEVDNDSGGGACSA
jgi:hypothetical protein